MFGMLYSIKGLVAALGSKVSSEEVRRAIGKDGCLFPSMTAPYTDLPFLFNQYL
jgi:hypothetical protein